MLQTNLLKRTICAAMALTLLCGGTLAHAEGAYQTEDAAQAAVEANVVEDEAIPKLEAAGSMEELQQTLSAKERAAIIKYVRTTVDLNVRSGAGMKYSIIGLLEKGSPAAVVSVSGKWYRIWYGSGYGYIGSRYTEELQAVTQPAEEIEETALSKTVKVTTALNVRKGPGTKYSVIGSLKKNSKAEVVAQSGSWYKIKYGKGYGYISKKYTKDADAAAPAETTVSKTVAVTTALNVRKGPGTKYAVIGSLKKNSKAEVVAQSGSWYKIKYGKGYGYISKKYTKDADAVTPSETTVSKTVTITTGLNVRKGPGTKYAVVGWLKKNATAEVVAQSGGWYKIKHKGGYGYISKKYTKDA